MAASVAKRDTGRARNGHDRPGRQQVKPGRPSRKRHRSAQDEDEDEDASEHLRKSRRIQERASKQLEQTPRLSSDTFRKSPRLQQKQAANQQRATRGGLSRPLQKPAVKQSNRRKEKDTNPTISPLDLLEAQKSTKRRPCANTEDELNHRAKRPRHRRAQHTEIRTGPDKEDLIENWLKESTWSHRALTENELRLLETSVNMPRKSATVLPSPDNTSPDNIFERVTPTSRRSEKSAASVHDTNYRQSLRYRNIFIECENPPLELMRRAQRITSRSRASPEMDDTTIQKLKDTSRMLQNETEAEIIQQLAPQIIPAMNKLPDQRLARSVDQLWLNSVSVPLNTKALTIPLPLPKPKPDLAFGYSQAAFTEEQLMTIDLLVDDQFGKSYAVPDQKVRFPFLEIEFKSQAKNGTHYIATNQAAGAGAVALNGYMDLMQRSFELEKFDYEEPVYFSISMDHELARINVHWLRAPAEKGGQHSFHVEGLSKHLLDDSNGIRALSRAIKNILDTGADARLRTLCGALDAYHETVIRNFYRPESHTGQQSRRGMLAPEVQAGVASCEEVTTSRPPLEQVQQVHTRAPASEVQAGVVTSYEEVRTSRTPIEPVRPAHNEQRSRRGAPVPEVQPGEDVFPGEKVRTSRVAPGPLQPEHAEQRPRRVPTATRRQVQKPVEIPAKATRRSSKRDSRVMEYD